MKDEHKLAAKVGVALGIVLLIVIAYYAGAFAPYGWAPMTVAPSTGNTGTGSTSTSNNGQYANPVGTFWVYDSAYEALNPAVTSLSYFEYYALRSGSYVPLGSQGATGYTQVETDAADKGLVYAVPVAATNEIFDAAKTAQANSAITAINFKDIFGTGNPEFVCTVSLNQVAKPVSGYPTLSLVAFYYSANPSDVTLSSPSNIVAGTGVASNYIEWSLTFSADAQAMAYYKIQVRMDVTSTSEAKVINIQIPGVGTVGGSSMNYWYDSSYQYFEYTVGTGTLGDCGFITCGLNQPLKEYVSVTVQSHLTQNVNITYTLFGLDYQGNTITKTDTAELTTS